LNRRVEKLASQARPGQKRVTVSLRSLVLALAVALPALLAAAPAAADEPVRTAQHDPGVYPPPSAQPGLFFVGLGATAGWYGAALGMSYLFPDAPGAEDLRIPVAGPWMALADTGCAADEPDCSIYIVVVRAILTTLDAVGQTGGVAVMAEAISADANRRRPHAGAGASTQAACLCVRAGARRQRGVGLDRGTF
jgi:hypothetical protein